MWFASLILAGCFHIPDEDWLPSKNKIQTWEIEKDHEIDEAINSFADGINMISIERDNLKDTPELGTTGDINEESIDSKDMINN